MSPKEIFLKKIQDQITVLEQAYSYNKQLPDLFFEGLAIPTSSLVSIPEAQPIQQTPLFEENKTDAEYGFYKKMVVKILKEKKVAMLKSQIVKEATKITGKEETGSITNAITGLSTDGVVKGYKPEGIKVRGNYWTLSNWWENEQLQSEYEPEPEAAINKYLN